MRYDRKLNILSIAIQNLKYRLARTNIMIFFISALVFSIFTSTILSVSMQNGITQTSERLGADIIVVPKDFSNSMTEALFLGEPCTFTFEREWVTKCQNVNGVERITTQLYLSTLTDSCCDSQIQLIAIDPKNDFIIQPWIAQKTKSKLLENEMVIGNNINLNVGDKAKFFGKYFLVSGKLTKTGMGYDNCIFINYNDAYRLMDVLNEHQGKKNKTNDNLISMVLIDVKDDYDINKVYEDLNKSYKNYVSVLKANSMFIEISRNIKSYSKFGDIFLSILFVISTIAILSIFTITINQRKKEFGVLSILGATNFQKVSIILFEMLNISIIGTFLGIFVSYIMIYIFEDYIRIKLQLPYLRPDFIKLLAISAKCLVISIISVLISSLYSIIQILKEDAFEQIKEGDSI